MMICGPVATRLTPIKFRAIVVLLMNRPFIYHRQGLGLCRKRRHFPRDIAVVALGLVLRTVTFSMI
jgi:hypothetical protein